MGARFQGVMQTIWLDVGSFFTREYHGQTNGKQPGTNCWQTFQAIFDVVNQVGGRTP